MSIVTAPHNTTLHWSTLELGTPPVTMSPLLNASLETPPPSDTSVSTPASVWSDGDRERLPTRALVCGAAAIVARLAAAGDAVVGRSSKLNAHSMAFALLNELSTAGLLPAHILVCAVSLAMRCSEALVKSISSFTAKRVLIACAVLAAKAESDDQYTLASYAAASGVSVDLLKGTELQVFERLDYNLGTSAARFQEALCCLLGEISCDEL
jgi:hypothetical protein